MKVMGIEKKNQMMICLHGNVMSQNNESTMED